MLSAGEVAQYFLWLARDHDDDLISNLKLQKLLYYAQGFHLAVFDKPLFKDSIKAWEHGPVVPAIYYQYKSHGRNGIEPADDYEPDSIDSQTRELLDEVYSIYGQFSAAGLRNLTHTEPPWKKTEQNGVISHESMRAFFRTRLITDEQET